MGLMDEVKSESNPPRRNKLDEIMEKLTKEDYQEFVQAVLDVHISQKALIRALQRRGIRIGTGTMSEMRQQFIRENGDDNDAA
jgi:hypothetical protein